MPSKAGWPPWPVRHAATPPRPAAAVLQTCVILSGLDPHERASCDQRITGKAHPLLKVGTFSLTRGRVFGEYLSAKIRFSPAPAGCAARPSGGSFHVWA